MKKLVLVFIIILLTSCSKSIYYAYEQDGDYCTLEVTEHNDVIYRGVSKNHYDKTGPRHISGSWDDSSPLYLAKNIYIYIESNDNGSGSFVSMRNKFTMYLIRIGNNNKFDMCLSSSKDNNSIVMYEKETKDSLSLFSTTKKNLLSNDCFKKNAIKWFPPYMKRIDKIDYKKFNLPQIKKKDLKNSGKAPMIFDQK